MENLKSVICGNHTWRNELSNFSAALSKVINKQDFNTTFDEKLENST